MGKRITKQELKEDILVSLLQKSIKYVQENITKIQMYGGIGIGVIILVVFGVNTFKGSGQKAQSEFVQAQQLYLQSSPIAPEGYKEAKKGFGQIQESHGRNQWAKPALFYQAMSCYQLKEYKQAINCFNTFMAKNPDHFFTPVAQEKIAGIYEQQQNFKEAIKAYQKLIQKFPQSFNTNYAHLSIGRCYEGLGDMAKAGEAYKKVLVKSAWADEARFYLKRLES